MAILIKDNKQYIRIKSFSATENTVFLNIETYDSTESRLTTKLFNQTKYDAFVKQIQDEVDEAWKQYQETAQSIAEIEQETNKKLRLLEFITSKIDGTNSAVQYEDVAELLPNYTIDNAWLTFKKGVETQMSLTTTQIPTTFEEAYTLLKALFIIDVEDC